MNYQQVGEALTEGLNLGHPPVGLAFLEDAPAGIPHYTQAVAAACAFWKAAQTSLFYATAEDHYNCPIGAMTQGFKLPAEAMEQGMSLIGQMGEIRYFDAAEVENVPAVEKPHQVVVYGPLVSFGGISPDVALIICTPFQAMLLSEATGATAWRGAGTEMHVFGRPACAVIPRAMKDSAASVSLGCMGARTFADIRDGEVLVAIPLNNLSGLPDESIRVLRANADMRRYYRDRKSKFAAV
jgi:uncharacterized protein (DUF169 family)